MEYVKINSKFIKLIPNYDPTVGLKKVKNFKDGQGMLFTFPTKDSNITMKDMKYPIDVLFINNGKVKEVVKALPGDEVQGHADTVLELPADYTNKANIKEGDSVKLLGNKKINPRMGEDFKSSTFIKNKKRKFKNGGKVEADSLYILDEEGEIANVMKLGTTIFSRQDTNKVFNKFKKLKNKSKNKKEDEYADLGKLYINVRTKHKKRMAEQGYDYV